jgi:restriction system protein
MPHDDLKNAASVGGCLILALAVVTGFIWAFVDNSWSAWGEFWMFAVVALLLAVAIGAAYSDRQSRAAWAANQEEARAARAAEEKHFRALNISNVDSMTGTEFEKYLQQLLTGQGYQVQTTPGSGDLGVDLIAVRGNESVAVQVKRYGSKLSRRAVSDAVAGMRHYQCSKAMVITNNYFMPGAVSLATSNDCMLVDRNTLADWITAFSTSPLSSPLPGQRTEASARIVDCPRCSQKLRVPQNRRVLRITCPKCANVFLS